ncbi:phosphate/phosphite/phosphonate ABC transporter substrate-binding protein [Kaarinaea lacus]
MKLARLIAAFFLLCIPVLALSQTLILSAPPRESAEDGKKLYGPLAEYLSGLLKKEVVYEHPGNWLNYQREMRADRYDIVFDGPHFAAWRMEHLGNRMVVKLPGELQFHLLAGVDNNTINTTEDLVGKRICGISPPNLSTLSVLAHYDNPVRQPTIKGITGGMGKVHQAFVKGECEAAVLRTTFYKKKLNDDDRRKMKIIYSSIPLPNQVLTVSKRISEADREKMQNRLLNDEAGKQAIMPIRKRFGGKARSFIQASNQEYVGNNQYLEGVIFGW